MGRKARKAARVKLRAQRREHARKAAEQAAMQVQVRSTDAVRSGYVKPGIRTAPVERKHKADSRLRWESHKGSACLRVSGNDADVLDLLALVRSTL